MIDPLQFFIVWAIVAICIWIGGFVFGEARQIERWRAACTKRNVARYHPQTGKWEWTVEETPGHG